MLIVNVLCSEPKTAVDFDRVTINCASHSNHLTRAQLISSASRGTSISTSTRAFVISLIVLTHRVSIGLYRTHNSIVLEEQSSFLRWTSHTHVSIAQDAGVLHRGYDGDIDQELRVVLTLNII
jgi:hypothetical protein